MEQVVIGLFGAGVVGGGVVEVLAKRKADLEHKGINVRIKSICCLPKDEAAVRALVGFPEDCELCFSFDGILNDPEINTVIELMGGTTFAKDVVFAAIEKDKHVITANKALVAKFMLELEELLAAHPTVKFLCEAAVAGGIPIINTMHETYAPENVTQIRGILNGTTNFMLSAMAKDGCDYDDILCEAQRLGFAEANPTADVEGHDAQNKIQILTKLAFGKHVPLDNIPTTGISSITATDFSYAAMLKSTIKLLGVAMRLPDEDKISVFVSPAIVPLTTVIGNVNGATNIVSITSDNLVEAAYVGQGAGRFPTANSVVQDICLLAKGHAHHPFPAASPSNAALEVTSDYSARFYVRLNIKDGTGIIKAVGELCEKEGISIYAVLQDEITDKQDVKFVVITDACKLSQVTNFSKAFEQQSFSLSAPLFMPLSD